MPQTRSIQQHCIEAYVNDKLIGYVFKTKESSNSIVTYIRDSKYYANLRRAKAMQRSAKASNICIIGNPITGMKLYPEQDAIAFKLIKKGE